MVLLIGKYFSERRILVSKKEMVHFRMYYTTNELVYQGHMKTVLATIRLAWWPAVI